MADEFSFDLTPPTREEVRDVILPNSLVAPGNVGKTFENYVRRLRAEGAIKGLGVLYRVLPAAPGNLREFVVEYVTCDRDMFNVLMGRQRKTAALRFDEQGEVIPIPVKSQLNLGYSTLDDNLRPTRGARYNQIEGLIFARPAEQELKITGVSGMEVVAYLFNSSMFGDEARRSRPVCIEVGTAVNIDIKDPFSFGTRRELGARLGSSCQRIEGKEPLVVTLKALGLEKLTEGNNYHLIVDGVRADMETGNNRVLEYAFVPVTDKHRLIRHSAVLGSIAAAHRFWTPESTMLVTDRLSELIVQAEGVATDPTGLKLYQPKDLIEIKRTVARLEEEGKRVMLLMSCTDYGHDFDGNNSLAVKLGFPDETSRRSGMLLINREVAAVELAWLGQKAPGSLIYRADKELSGSRRLMVIGYDPNSIPTILSRTLRSAVANTLSVEGLEQLASSEVDFYIQVGDQRDYKGVLTTIARTLSGNRIYVSHVGAIVKGQEQVESALNKINKGVEALAKSQSDVHGSSTRAQRAFRWYDVTNGIPEELQKYANGGDPSSRKTNFGTSRFS